MIAWETESVLSARVNTLAVGEHVGEGVHLSEHGAIRHNLLLNAIDLLSDAEVNDFVDVLGLSALVLFEVLLGALALLSLVRVTHLG